MNEILNKMLQGLLHSIYPTRCAACQKVVTANDLFCSECADRISTVSGAICIRCFSPKADCRCDEMPPEYEQVCAPFEYFGAVRDMLLNLKEQNDKRIVEYLGDNMYSQVIKRCRAVRFDCVMAVPMHKEKRSIRGYNQSELLGRYIAEKLKLPFDNDTLTQSKMNKTQHELGLNERIENVSGIYSAKENSYKNILLVDDIITTGSTLSSCALTLKNAGTKAVYCIGAAKNILKNM